jgi:hypothetical protein
MTVAVDSRYANGEIVVVPRATDSYDVALFSPPIEFAGVPYEWRQVVLGDRFDTMAISIFADPTKWWVIADLNPEITWPGTLMPGALIRVPSVRK